MHARTTKYGKLARREGADFIPVICSAHGALAPEAKLLITQCAMRITNGKDARNYGRTVARLRARVQAAVVRSVAQSIMCRTRKDDTAEKLRKERNLRRYDVHWHLA